MGGAPVDPHAGAAAHVIKACDRILAATQPLLPGEHAHAPHHNYQLPLFGLTLILVGGGAIQHFGGGLPVPYTVLLLIFGFALGAWVIVSVARFQVERLLRRCSAQYCRTSIR